MDEHIECNFLPGHPLYFVDCSFRCLFLFSEKIMNNNKPEIRQSSGMGPFVSLVTQTIIKGGGFIINRSTTYKPPQTGNWDEACSWFLPLLRG